MRQLLIIPSVFFALMFSAHATSVELPITPNQLDQQNYKFAVTTTATNDAVAFHVVITAKQSEIFADSEGNLAVAAHTKDTQGGRGTEIKPFQPTVPIALNKDKHVWTADLTSHAKR